MTLQARASPKNSQLCSTAAVPAAQCLQRRVSSFLHSSSCDVLRSRRVCNGTLQAAAAACKGFPELFAAETVSAAEFARRAGRRCVMRFADVTCLQCGSLQGVPAARGASPRNSQLAAQPGGAAASFLPGSTAGGGTDCCNAVRQRARRPDTADSATALHVTSLYRLHTFWHLFVNRQYLQHVLCHRRPFVGFSTFDSSNSVHFLVFSNEVDYLRWVGRLERARALGLLATPAEFSPRAPSS